MSDVESPKVWKLFDLLANYRQHGTCEKVAWISFLLATTPLPPVPSVELYVPSLKSKTNKDIVCNFIVIYSWNNGKEVPRWGVAEIQLTNHQVGIILDVQA